MDRRNNDPEYTLHEPANDPGRERPADQLRERSVEDENDPWAVQRRQNMNQPPPSEVQESREEHGVDHGGA